MLTSPAEIDKRLCYFFERNLLNEHGSCGLALHEIQRRSYTTHPCDTWWSLEAGCPCEIDPNAYSGL
jgi:hypothetical protein